MIWNEINITMQGITVTDKSGTTNVTREQFDKIMKDGNEEAKKKKLYEHRAKVIKKLLNMNE
jgi:hypothetical protein